MFYHRIRSLWCGRVNCRALVIVLVSLGIRSGATASSFTNLVVFGDSLSDNGNVAYIFKNYPGLIPKNLPLPEPTPPLYTANRYTNGPDITPTTKYQGVWVEQLANKLGVPDPQPGLPNFFDPTAPAGGNLAVAGTFTNSGPLSISSMVTSYISANPGGLSSTSLYVLLGGSIDLLRAADPVAAAPAAVASIFSDVTLLEAAGARHFLVPDLPDLGATPLAAKTGETAQLSAASLQYEQSWKAALSAARGNGTNVTGVDLFALLKQVEANPAGYGLVNTKDPAQGSAVDPDSYLFWDILHPTTKGHSLIADAAFDDLTAAPEPQSIFLLAAGMLALLGLTLSRVTK